MRVELNRAADGLLRTKLGDNLDEAGRLLVQEIQGAIAIQGPPRSTPGEAPHIDTGDLIASYRHETDRSGLGSRVGSDVPYSVNLELGTPTMAARPHVIPTLLTTADALAHEIAKP